MIGVVSILGYHKIGPPSPSAWDTWYYVPTEAFARHMDWLAEHEFHPITASQFVDAMRGPESLPPRAVLITFDDGYRSVLQHAVPILKRHQFPAVSFVPTAHVGSASVWDADTREPVEPICSWDELRELQSAGVSVQSHAVTHRTFSDLTAAQIGGEAQDSKRSIERSLASSVQLRAYPYSDAGRDTAATAASLRQAGYAAGLLFTGGVARLGQHDPFLLPRIPVWPDTDLAKELAP